MYSISDLERISGIKAHTIRIWEKRYKLLDPERTEGNHRLYTDQDLIRLLNVQQLVTQGLKISNVAKWEKKKIIEKVRDYAFRDRDESSEVEYYCNLWLDSALHFDEDKFCSVYLDLRSRMTFLDLWQNFMVPTLHDMGQLWLTEDIVPAEEHFFSQLVRRKILAEIDQLPLPEFKGTPAILFLPPGEYHELGLLVAEYILRKEKVLTINLGADMPIENIKKIVAKKTMGFLISYVQGVSIDPDFLEYIKSLKGRGIKIVLNGHLVQDDRLFLENQDHIYGFNRIDDFNEFIIDNIKEMN